MCTVAPRAMGPNNNSVAAVAGAPTMRLSWSFSWRLPTGPTLPPITVAACGWTLGAGTGGEVIAGGLGGLVGGGASAGSGGVLGCGPDVDGGQAWSGGAVTFGSRGSTDPRGGAKLGRFSDVPGGSGNPIEPNAGVKAGATGISGAVWQLGPANSP
jgi:hypothetical protein